MLHGHDVSNWQGQYNWDQVKGSDGFGVAKATEGTTMTDAQFSRNWGQMKLSGLLRGAYHFGHPSMNAPAQATFFVDSVKKQGLEQDDVLILDLETTDNLGPSSVSAWAQVFCTQVQKLSGKNCWVYTNHSFVANGCCNGLYNQPLWVASLGLPGQVGSVWPWPVWTMQQYTWNPVDQNVLNGDAVMWRKLANIPEPSPAWSLAQYKTTGREGSLAAWAKTVSHLPSTVLRLTCEHSKGDLFPANVAGWLNSVLDGTAKPTDPMPVGLVLYYMKAA